MIASSTRSVSRPRKFRASAAAAALNEHVNRSNSNRAAADSLPTSTYTPFVGRGSSAPEPDLWPLWDLGLLDRLHEPLTHYHE